jgi:hypothetical protein
MALPPTSTPLPPPPQYPSVPQVRHSALVKHALHHLTSTLNDAIFLVCHGAALLPPFCYPGRNTPVSLGSAPSSHRTCSPALNIDNRPCTMLFGPRGRPPPLLCVHYTILLCTSGSAPISHRKCSTAPHIDIKPSSVLYLPRRRPPPPLLHLHCRNTLRYLRIGTHLSSSMLSST